MALVTAKNYYTDETLLVLENGPSSFEYKLIVSADAIKVEHRPVVIVGDTTIALRDSRTINLSNMPSGGETISIKYDAELTDTTSLLEIFETNEVYSAQIMLEYNVDDGREIGFAPVENLYIVARLLNPKALITANNQYTDETLLVLENGPSSFRYRVIIPTDAMGVKHRPVVIVGGTTIALGDFKTSYLPDIVYDTTHVSIGYDAELTDTTSLLEIFETNGVYDAQIMIQYNLDEGREIGFAPVKNLYIVVQLLNPKINDFVIYRHENGEEVSDGIEIKIEARLTIDYAANISNFPLKLFYAENDDATEESPSIELMSSINEAERNVSVVVNYADFGITFSNNSSWSFILRFGDDAQYTAVSANIPKAFANLHLSGKKTGGICMGGFSKSEEGNPLFECHYPTSIGMDSTSTPESPKFECHYPAFFYGGIALGGGSGDYPAPGTELNTGGKWFNGKPIYRAIIETGAKTSNTMNYDVSAFNIEHYISIRGMFYGQADYGDGYIFPAPAAHMNNVNWTIQLEAVDRTKVSTGATSRTWKSGLIILEYTKTTDDSVVSE